MACLLAGLFTLNLPGALAGKPPSGNHAKCGFTRHTTVNTRDYVFTDYGHR